MTSLPLRARTVLRVPLVWIFPLAVPAVMIVLMTFIYIGSVVNPIAHLHGLPVVVVNQDKGATIDGTQLNEGDTVAHALNNAPGVSSRLALHSASLSEAESEMNKGREYAAIVIPPQFTASLLAAAGESLPSASPPPARSTVQLLENVRLGSLGVSLASGVATPALRSISEQIGAKLVARSTATAHSTAYSTALLNDPIVLKTSQYRPLPSNAALGLSAFYMSLLAMMAGFLGATIINSSIDGALGYATTELGPRWKQRRPLPIARRQTLLLKWTVSLVAIPLLTAAIVGVAAGILRMDAPNVAALWALLTLASWMVSFTTLALFAAFGSIGQLLAMLVLVYLSLSSSGGTIPTQALPGFYNFVGRVEPLRQVLIGTRSILYFGVPTDADLLHAAVVLGVEVLVAIGVGLAITTWYDYRRLYRLSPALIDYVGRSADERKSSGQLDLTSEVT